MSRWVEFCDEELIDLSKNTSPYWAQKDRQNLIYLTQSKNCSSDKQKENLQN